MDGTVARGAEGPTPEVSVVVVVHGDDPWLRPCLTAILASEGIRVELVLVENGGSEEVLASIERDPRVVVVRPRRNTGFASGCDLGVAKSTAPIVALINPNAIVEPGALRALCSTASEPGVGLATASLRLADRPDRMNCTSNLVTIIGGSRTDHLGEPAVRFTERFDVVGASGAGLAIRRDLWDALGGFDEIFFMYWEDTDLSIRAIQRGWRVVYEPAAVIVHRFESTKDPERIFLLERNRIITGLSCFSTRHLVAIAPLLAVMEIGMFGVAAHHGWLDEKARAFRWVIAHRSDIRRRRREVQAARTAPDARLLDLLSTTITPDADADCDPGVLDRSVRLYWRIARALLRI